MCALVLTYSRQALGQCAKYITEHFPNAALQKMASTAAAAQALVDEDPEHAHSAAICSPLCAVIFEGLEIFQEGVQDTDCMLTNLFTAHFTDTHL